jgi:predicted nuclease with TOPRIM domain
MPKRLMRRYLARLRGFMQAEIVAEIRLLRDEVQRLGGDYERLRDENHALRVSLDRLHEEQERFGATLDGLHGEHEALRATLARLDLFDQTARSVEDGLLSLALLRKPEEPPQTREASPKEGTT